MNPKDERMDWNSVHVIQRMDWNSVHMDLLEDSSIDIRQEIMDRFRQEICLKLDEELMKPWKLTKKKKTPRFGPGIDKNGIEVDWMELEEKEEEYIFGFDIGV